MTRLFIDVETYCEEPLGKSGAYRYFEHPSFEVLMIAYCFEGKSIKIIDLAQGEELPIEFVDALRNPKVEKHAHNAKFERICFKTIGFDIPVEQWYCTMVKAAYCGWPLSLGAISKAMDLGEDGKDKQGKALIRYFCLPCKPTKVNGGRTRNLPHHNIEKWVAFKQYCIQDVAAEMKIDFRLEDYIIPDFERRNYILDQKINDRGVLVDLELAAGCLNIHGQYIAELIAAMKEATNLANPNSVAQLKSWLSARLGKPVLSLAKDRIKPLMDGVKDSLALEVLAARREISKTSIKKYVAMQLCHGADHRIRGLLEYYGANRTGRWAGRLVQVQNLPRNYIEYLEDCRKYAKDGDYEIFDMVYGDISNHLSQLIRTAFVAPKFKTFAVADFSAIEARVIAWLADETWRLEVFETHGKIYEASASMMFGVPLEQITKGSDLRQRGKVAELALGYQGSVGAMRNMGAEKMGLDESEMKQIVTKWREANPRIVNLWHGVEKCCMIAMRNKGEIIERYRLKFLYDGVCLTIQLPSQRKLFYVDPSFTTNNWGQKSIQYKGISQTNKQWVNIDTYGGKLIENITQAIARDLLAEAMLALDKEGYKIVMHVHDEAISEIDEYNSETTLNRMCEVMGRPIPWAEGLPLDADGYVTPFYKKD